VSGLVQASGWVVAALLGAALALVWTRSGAGQVTARSRERRLVTLLRSAAEVVAVVGPDRVPHFASPAVERVLGYATDEAGALDWYELTHPDDRPVLLQLAARIRAARGTTATGELRLRAAAGDYVWVEVRAVDETANPDVRGIVIAVLDISERKSATTDERLRISRELHDSVSQALFSMSLQARAAQLELDAEGISPDGTLARTIGDVADLARGALAEIRALIFELRPDALREEGVVSAIRKHGAAIAARYDVPVTVRAPQARIVLGEHTEEHLFRVILEAVANAARHAGASRVDVEVASAGDPPWITTTVTDDGRGFDPGQRFAGHLGLETMRERVAVLGGQLQIDSRPGTGTVVAVALPTDADQPASLRGPSGESLPLLPGRP